MVRGVTALLSSGCKSQYSKSNKKINLILLSLSTAAQVVSSHRFDSRSDLSSGFLSVCCFNAETRGGKYSICICFRNPKCARPPTLIHLYGHFSRRRCTLANIRLICLVVLVWERTHRPIQPSASELGCDQSCRSRGNERIKDGAKRTIPVCSEVVRRKKTIENEADVGHCMDLKKK